MINASRNSINCDVFTTATSAYNVVAITLYVMVILSTLLFLFVLWRSRLMQNSAHYYVTSFTISELINSIFLIVSLFISNCNPIVCWVIFSFIILLTASSVLHMCVIAIDRYIFIVHAIHYRRIVTDRFRYGLLATPWILAIVLALIPVFALNYGSNRGYFCVIPEFHTILLSSLFILFITVAVVLYSRIWILVCTLKPVQKNSLSKRKENPVTEMMAACRRHLHYAKPLMLVLASFLFSWLPLCLWILVAAFQNMYCPTAIEVFQWVWLVRYAGSFLNPIIYGWNVKSFRKSVMAMLPFGCGGSAAGGPQRTVSMTRISREVSRENSGAF